MTPKLITFDSAGTLVAVPQGWSMGWFVGNCAREIGLNATAEEEGLYQSLFDARLSEFVAVNMARDPVRQKGFWQCLAQDWLAKANYPPSCLQSLERAADELGFGQRSILFKLFDDVIPCLDRLDSLGIKAAVISNWDYSLHRVLRIFGIYDRFITVVASLEEGIEKPDPRLFEMALARAAASPEETLHVGDDPLDDIEGASRAGMRSILIDRSLSASVKPTICSLIDLPEALDWID